MLKVALVHERVGGESGGGGGVRLMLELALALKRMGHEVVVVTHQFEPGTEFGNASRELEVRAVHTGKVVLAATRRDLLRQRWRAMPKVAKLVPDDVDVVNSHEWPGLRAGRLAARRLGVPHVWTRNDESAFERAAIPDETVEALSGAAGRLVRGIVAFPDFLDARAADAITVLDTRNARMVRRAYRREASIVRCGPARAFFDPPERDAARRALGLSADDFLALGLGILFPHRRFEDLIEAVSLLDDRPAVRARIVGSDRFDPGYADGLSELVRVRGLADRVELVRRSVTDDELRAAYAAADVFVFPNQRQTWGLAPLEALASGTPVIVSRGAGVHEVLEGRPGVVTVAPERPDEIASALRSTLDSGARDGALETRDWIRTELSSDRQAEEMTAIFESLRARASG